MFACMNETIISADYHAMTVISDAYCAMTAMIYAYHVVTVMLRLCDDIYNDCLCLNI